MGVPEPAYFNPRVLSLKLWLYTNLLGCLGWAIWLFCTNQEGWVAWTVLISLITLFSMATSLLTIPIATWFFASVRFFARAKRLVLVFFGILLLWLLPIAVMMVITTG